MDFFGGKTEPELVDVLRNHLSLVNQAFPNIQMNDQVIGRFIKNFNEQNSYQLKADDGAVELMEWDSFVDLNELFGELMFPSAEIKTDDSNVKKMVNSAVNTKHQ